jgi:hypothetical protein
MASAAGAAALGPKRVGASFNASPRPARTSASLGMFEAKYLIRLMQANAKMFDKYGA